MGKKKIIKIFIKRKKAFKNQYKKLAKDFTEKNIHDFRVSYRRLKSVYDTLKFSGFSINKKLKKNTNKVFNILGEIRDFQVNLNLLENLYFPEKVPEAISNIINYKIVENKKLLQKNLKKNKKEIFSLIKIENKKLRKHIKLMDKDQLEKSLLEINDIFEKNIEVCFSNLSKDINTHHALRLTAKKYKYFLENFGDMLKIDIEKYVQMKNIQELLGDITDLNVLRKNTLSMNLEVEEKIIKFMETRLQNKINEFKINF